MAIDVKILVEHQKAIADVKAFTGAVDRETKKLQGDVSRSFRNMATNMAQSVSGSASGIVGAIGQIKHPAALAVVSIAAIGGAFAVMANKAAQATETTSAESRQFLARFDSIKSTISDTVDTIGTKAIPIFNSLAESMGLAATEAEVYLRNQKRAFEIKEEIMKGAPGMIESFRVRNVDPDIVKSLKESLDLVKKLQDAGAERLEIDRAISMAQMLYEAASGKLLEERKKRQEETAREEKQALEELGRRKKELHDSVMAAIKAEKDARREEMREAIDAMDVALKRDRTEFGEELERQRAGLKSPQEIEKNVNEQVNQTLEKQKDLYKQIGQNIQSAVSNLAQAIVFAQDLGSAIKSIIASFIQLAISRFLPIPLGANGLIAMQHGSIVNRPTPALIGEAGPEAVVPLSPGKSRQRQEIMDAAGLSSGSITLNISMPNVRIVDDLSIRNELLPAINKQIRRGEKLLASKVK